MENQDFWDDDQWNEESKVDLHFVFTQTAHLTLEKLMIETFCMISPSNCS